MIDILDYGMGNLGSIQNMLKRIGQESKIITQPNEILNSKKLILPGVGAFDKAMQSIVSNNQIDALHETALQNKIPILGICLGMQIMLSQSEEGHTDGLSWIEGEVTRFHFEDTAFKVPHMGWNQIDFSPSHPLFQNLPENSRYYFVHAYYATCKHPTQSIATSNYGTTFTCAIAKDNIMGVQFHPEKSHVFGMQLLKNFSSL